MGLSIAFLMMMIDMEDMTSQMNTKKTRRSDPKNEQNQIRVQQTSLEGLHWYQKKEYTH